MISIILNGEPRQVRGGSIADLVASLGLDVKKVAVERNRDIVPRSTLGELAAFFTLFRAALPIGFSYALNGGYAST